MQYFIQILASVYGSKLFESTDPFVQNVDINLNEAGGNVEYFFLEKFTEGCQENSTREKFQRRKEKCSITILQNRETEQGSIPKSGRKTFRPLTNETR